MRRNKLEKLKKLLRKHLPYVHGNKINALAKAIIVFFEEQHVEGEK